MAGAVSSAQFDRSLRAMRSTWQRLTDAEAERDRQRRGEADLRAQLMAAERRAEEAENQLAAAQRERDREREAHREALKKQTARADLEQRKFAQLAQKLGILKKETERDTQRSNPTKRPRPSVSPADSSVEREAQRDRDSRSENEDELRPRVVRRLDAHSHGTSAPGARAAPTSRAPVVAPRQARAGPSDNTSPAVTVDPMSAAGQSAPSNMQRLIDAGLLSRATRVFQGQGAQLARDKYAQASGHRCMLAYGLPSGGGNCYLSFPDQTTFAEIYHRMLLKVADPSVRLQPRVGLDDICFYEQLYLPCSWYFDVEEEASGRPLPNLSQQMIAAIREAARGKGITDIGPCSVTDGSRASKDKHGYKNSLHLVFSKSPVCPHPTSNAAAPDFPPLLAAQHVHSRMDVKDAKGALQPDIGVYTTRRNMRLVGSCKVGQPVPLVPADAFPHLSGFSNQLWVEWLKTSQPKDLLQYMISRDDGVTELNWQTEPSAGGPRRVNGTVDNWDVLGPALGGVMSQAAAGLSPVADNRMPPLKAWVNKTPADDGGVDDWVQSRNDPRSSNGDSHSSTRHSCSARRGQEPEQDSSRDGDRGSGRRAGGAGGIGGGSSRFYRGNRNSSRRGSDSHSSRDHPPDPFDDDMPCTSTRSNTRGGSSGSGAVSGAFSGAVSGAVSAGRAQHRSMTRQAFDAPSPSGSRTSSGGGGRITQRSGSFSRQQPPQPLAVTTLNPVQQRILRHQNQNGVVRNQSVRAEMTGLESDDLKQYADAMGLSPSSRAQLRQDCSRHRAPVAAVFGSASMLPPAGPPPTPPGYWDTSIPDSETQDLD